MGSLHGEQEFAVGILIKSGLIRLESLYVEQESIVDEYHLNKPGKLARAGLPTVPAVARSGGRPQLPKLLRRYVDDPSWFWLGSAAASSRLGATSVLFYNVSVTPGC